jgi:hypothetical protein
MNSPTIRLLARTEKPLVLPGAHDALPDIGLCQLGEFTAALRDIIGIDRGRGIEQQFGQD